MRARVDGALACAAAAVAGGMCAVYPASVLLVGLIAGCALAAHLTPRVRTCVLVAFALNASRGAFELRAFEARRITLRDAIGPPSRCDLQARVVRSPTWVDGTASFVARVTQAECGEHALPVPFVARLHGGPDALARGDRVHAVADLAPVQLFRNLDAADPTPNAARSGIVITGGVLSLDIIERNFAVSTLIDRERARARRRIVATFAPQAAAMARALMLGESDLSAEDALAFQKSGLSHMLAVSGSHLVFAVVALVEALRFLLVRVEVLAARFVVGRLTSALGVGLALFYADFAGGSGSAWRAAFMLSVAFSARALGRPPLTVRTFGLSTLVFAIVDPLCAFDLSFLLSVAATAGLIWIGRPLAQRCERIQSRGGRFLATSFATTLSATIPCAPLLALLASGITLAGLVANVLAAPLGEAVALPLCLSHLLLAPFPALERGVALVASGALLIVKRIARLSASASDLALVLPEPGRYQVAVVAVFVLGLIAIYATEYELGSLSRKRTVAVWSFASCLALCVLEVATRSAGKPCGVLRVSALDVGQGDANLLDFPDGRALLIDAGGFVGSPVDPGLAVVLPVLRARRRTRLDVVVLSHPHPDHFTGLVRALKEVEVGEFWDTGQGEAEGAGPLYAELLASLRARGIPIRGPGELCSAPHPFGTAVLRVLSPCPHFAAGLGANDNSFVISVALGTRRFLFMGDAEREAETRLLRDHAGELHADYLKVGHHGSRTSTSEAFLTAVAPTLASLSCGVRNRFGHPHLETVERLRAHGVQTFRLDRSGGLEIVSDGQTFAARTTRVPL